MRSLALNLVVIWAMLFLAILFLLSLLMESVAWIWVRTVDKHKRRIQARKEIKKILDGECSHNIGRINSYTEDDVKRLYEFKRREYVVALLDMGRARGGTDIHSCVLNLHGLEHSLLMTCVGWPRVGVDSEDWKRTDIPLQEAVLLFLMQAWDAPYNFETEQDRVRRFKSMLPQKTLAQHP